MSRRHGSGRRFRPLLSTTQGARILLDGSPLSSPEVPCHVDRHGPRASTRHPGCHPGSRASALDIGAQGQRQDLSSGPRPLGWEAVGSPGESAIHQGSSHAACATARKGATAARRLHDETTFFQRRSRPGGRLRGARAPGPEIPCIARSKLLQSRGGQPSDRTEESRTISLVAERVRIGGRVSGPPDRVCHAWDTWRTRDPSSSLSSTMSVGSPGFSTS